MSSPVAWTADGTPRSAHFDDIYRSSGMDGQGGLQQARHVFLAGCGLYPSTENPVTAWAGCEQWHVLETGFGLGLNFLATWQAWQADPQRPQRLFFTSVEAWPVTAQDIQRSCQPFPELANLAQQLVEQWHGLLPGVHRLRFEDGRVQLTLCIGLAQDLLPTLDAEVHSVFLDGFNPTVNAELWALPVLKAIAKQCRPGTQLATWSLARSLRDDLLTAGFEVSKAPGLPPKRHCLRACFAPRWTLKTTPRSPVVPANPARQAVVVGGGLSGAACAYSLAERGWQVLVLDSAAEPASGASGLPVGIFAPHVSPDDAPLSRFTRAGVRMVQQRARDLLAVGVDWHISGVVEHQVEGKHRLPSSTAWQQVGSESSRSIDSTERASTHLPDSAQALWHVQAGWLRPAALVQAQLRHPNIRWQGSCTVSGLRPDGHGAWQVLDASGQPMLSSQHVVLACAYESQALLENSGLVAPPLQPLRGQVSWGELASLPPTVTALLPTAPVNGHGSFISGPVGPSGAPCWIAGSTFERSIQQPATHAQDHAANLGKLQRLLPDLAQALTPHFETAHAWAGLRCTLPDRFPAVGTIAPGLAICTGMGARGLSLSVLCGELLAAEWHAEPWPIERKLAHATAAPRFSKKQRA